MKHTPGPWNIRNELDERGLFVIDTYSESEIASARQYANARLIAAAPDMFDELVCIRIILKANLNVPMEVLDEVIERATGDKIQEGK